MTTAADMKTKFLEFVSFSDATIEDALSDAELLIGENWTWRGRELGVMYLAAHFLAITKASATAAGREVVSETIGRLSRTFARTTGASIGELQTTAYGSRYLSLKHIGSPHFRVIGPWWR